MVLSSDAVTTFLHSFPNPGLSFQYPNWKQNKTKQQQYFTLPYKTWKSSSYHKTLFFNAKKHLEIANCTTCLRNYFVCMKNFNIIRYQRCSISSYINVLWNVFSLSCLWCCLQALHYKQHSHSYLAGIERANFQSCWGWQTTWSDFLQCC